MILLFFACLMCQPLRAVSESAVRSDTTRLSNSDKWNIHLSYVVGYKQLSESWIPARHHLEFGLVDFDFGHNEWPANICMQLLLSYSPVRPRLEGFLGDYSGAYEFNVGIRKLFFPEGTIHPHVAAGIGILGAATTTRLKDFGYVQEANVAALGYWGSVGFFWIASEAFLTGASVEYSHANITLFNQRLNAGGLHFLFSFGWHM